MTNTSIEDTYNYLSKQHHHCCCCCHCCHHCCCEKQDDKGWTVVSTNATMPNTFTLPTQIVEMSITEKPGTEKEEEKQTHL